MWLIGIIIFGIFAMIWFSFNAPVALVDLIPFIKVKKDFSGNSEQELDYSDPDNWFINTGDIVPTQKADVFFVHRTTFLSGSSWNASIKKKSLNKKTYRFSIKTHTDIFNGIANVYAPKYRQATLYSFYDETDNGKQALDFAYQDVKNAFTYYFKNCNNNNPIILAGHSQGTFHLERIMEEIFDTFPEMKMKLICAYLVAMPVKKNRFETIFPSTNKDDIHCYVSWSTFGKNAFPLYFKGQYDDALCTNPISWKNNSNEITFKEDHIGARTYYLNRLKKNCVRVFVDKGVLQINHLMFGFFKLRKQDYVTMDYHIFYENIRKNVQNRIRIYYKTKNEKQKILHRDSSHIS